MEGKVASFEQIATTERGMERMGEDLRVVRSRDNIETRDEQTRDGQLPNVI